MSLTVWTRFVEPRLVVRRLVPRNPLTQLILQDIRQDLSGKPTCNTFALKVQSSKTCHKNEFAAFSHFRSSKSGARPSSNLPKFYGSFIQDGMKCLILEYVDGPNLLKYLEETPPPQTSADLLLFWKSYWGIFEGLHHVHQIVHLPAKVDFSG